MKNWLIVHSLESYGQNSRMIGLPGKTKLDGSPVLDENGKPQPAFKIISEIKPILIAYINAVFNLLYERAPKAAPTTDVTAVAIPNNGKTAIITTLHPVL